MPVKIIFCYAHEDEVLLKRLKIHLSPLQREGLIWLWYDRDISAGTEWKHEIDKRLNSANIILLLVSPDFMNSDYCYSIEMKRALERHDNGEARVVPIILRPVTWKLSLGKLQALPRDGNPVKGRYWHNMDEAFSDVTQGIYKIINSLSVGFKHNERDISLIQYLEMKRDNNSDLTIDGPTAKIPHIEDVEKIKESLLALSGARTVLVSEKRPMKTNPVRSSLLPSMYIAIGKESGRVYEINNSISIGRRLDNDIFLEDPLVSRQHALVYVASDRTCILKDLGSANGTIVNRKNLLKDEVHILNEGDEIEIGDTLFVFTSGLKSM